MKLGTATWAIAIALSGTWSAFAQGPSADNPLFVPATADEALVQLVDTLGEPRHFCLDIPGFPVSGVLANHREASWALEAHTCKTGIPDVSIATIDQLLSQNDLAAAPGTLRYTRFDACVEVVTFRNVDAPAHTPELMVRQDAPLVVNPCSGAIEQSFVLDDAGRLRSLLDEEKCLTIGQQAFEAGNRAPGEPWLRRALTFSACTDAAADRQTWALAAPTS
jgi:hypothetical protein|tara:strand:- start:33488 stop:34150 length:663 start_codon:yes stop_codon:yes gene_type:complete